MLEEWGEYAVQADDIEDVHQALHRALGWQFEAPDSGYKGPYLAHKQGEHFEVEIFYNCDPMWRDGDPEEEWFFKPEVQSHGVLIEARLSMSLLDELASAILQAFPTSVELVRVPFPI